MASYEYTVTLKSLNQKTSNEPNLNKDGKLSGTSQVPSLDKEAGETDLEKSAMKTVILAQAKKYTLYALSNIGKATGDSKLQNDVNNVVEVVSLGVSAYINPILLGLQALYSTTTTLVNYTVEKVAGATALSVKRARNGYTDTESITTSRRH